MVFVMFRRPLFAFEGLPSLLEQVDGIAPLTTRSRIAGLPVWPRCLDGGY